jgi:NAD(P)-dependent dehydrogenase (short-subunit alcohol dehydrogenase family)
MRLEGKRKLLTGTGGGQGEAAQAMFAREGARIVGCDIQEGAAERTAVALSLDSPRDARGSVRA